MKQWLHFYIQTESGSDDVSIHAVIRFDSNQNHNKHVFFRTYLPFKTI